MPKESNISLGVIDPTVVILEMKTFFAGGVPSGFRGGPQRNWTEWSDLQKMKKKVVTKKKYKKKNDFFF